MTLILALDTTSAHCAVALVRDGSVVASETREMSKGQAEHLVPIMHEVLRGAKVSLKELDAIAVATGPGNFTGVRICVSTARGLALALKIPAIGVSVMEALAYKQTHPTLSIVDARAGMIYTQLFQDGTALSVPKHLFPKDLQDPGLSDLHCAGFKADHFATLLGASTYETALPSPETYAFVAASRDWSETPRPTPLYIRNADAALPSEPAPHIIS